MTAPKRMAALVPLGVGAVILAASLFTGSPDIRWGLRLAGAGAATAAAVVVLGGPSRRTTEPDAFEAVWWREAGSADEADPPERQTLQRLVRLAVGSADVAHERLRPVLRDLADARFEAAFGTHPDHDPLAAERLGPAWEWIRPGRREPPDRHAPGPSSAELADVVAAIERLPTGDDRP